MLYNEEELLFEGRSDGEPSRGLGFSGRDNDPDEFLGIKVRIGQSPIVTDIRKLLKLRSEVLAPEMELLLGNKDLYTVVHAIGVRRLQGKAKVEELQYESEVVDVPTAQTRDLLPNNKFKEVIRVDAKLESGLSASGNFSAEIPAELMGALIPNKSYSLGGDINLELAAESTFIGKISCSVKLPITIAAGVGSNTASWVLNPDENPLLGDQLLVQTIAVPRGTKSITYKMQGVLKADKGLFWRKKEMKTQVYEVRVTLLEE